MTEGGNNLTQHENDGISEKCEERDFDNSHYTSGTLEDGGYDAVPESSTPQGRKSRKSRNSRKYQI